MSSDLFLSALHEISAGGYMINSATWNEVKTMTQNEIRWKLFVAALAPPRAERNEVK